MWIVIAACLGFVVGVAVGAGTILYFHFTRGLDRIATPRDRLLKK